MASDLRRRLVALEGRNAPEADRLAQMERDAEAFVARIETMARDLDPTQAVAANSFRDSILASRDPFLIKAFGLVEYGDWDL